MTSFPHPWPGPRARRRLKAATVARRCVGSLILLAGAAIVTGDLVALLRGGDSPAAGLGAGRPGLRPQDGGGAVKPRGHGGIAEPLDAAAADGPAGRWRAPGS